MPEVSGKLDFSLMPGKPNMERWQMRASDALTQNPEFVRAGKEGKAIVWRLNKAHMPVAPASKAIQRDKGKFMGQGKSMGQGGH